MPKTYDKAIINPNDWINMANIINPLIKEYRKSSIINTDRGFCKRESDNFIFWLQDEHKDIFDNLVDTANIKVVDGYFNIDYPEGIDLDIMDLNSVEGLEFMDLYEDNVDFTDNRDVSHYIWEYIQHYVDDDRLGDFYSYNHAWIDLDGLIIDFTWEQFKNAIAEQFPSIERYEYL